MRAVGKYPEGTVILVGKLAGFGWTAEDEVCVCTVCIICGCLLEHNVHAR